MAQRTAAIAVETTPLPPEGNTQLRIAIAKAGIPQHRIAKQLRITAVRLSRIVRGRAEPTDDEQDQLAELLQRPRGLLFRSVAR